MTYANLRPTACALLLLTWASGTTAFTLERSRGSVILGRPLDFSVQASLNAGEDAASLCLEADVLQADAPISPSRVKIQLLKAGGDGLSTVRVSSLTIVEEPVLTVVVKYGCLSKNSRKYVVFADPPASVNESVTVSSGAPAFGPSPTAQADPIPTPRQVIARTSRVVIAAPRKKTTLVASGSLAQSRRLQVAAPAKSIRPRLQLEGLESTAEPVARLKATLELPAVPSELVSAQRLEAAALWRVISAQSEDLRQDIQRLTALQAETIALREASSKNRIEISRLAVQLKEAENSHHQNPLVYALTALIALLVGGFAFMRFGRNKTSVTTAWWNPRREKNESNDATQAAELKATYFPKVVTQQREPIIPLKANTITRLSDRKEQDALSTQPKFKPSESAYSMLGAQGNPRGVNVEELFDIQQQADFFISLGQHEQAIEVLNNHIRENAQTSPLVYLDLLKLYHRQDRRADYHDLTTEFTRLFNVDVPAFDAFQDKTRGLEAYEGTLSQIESFWHTDEVLDIIETSVFREPGRASEALDLEAYRELLLLHSIAKDLSENQVRESNPSDSAEWPKIALQPANASTSALPAANFTQTMPQKLAPTINTSVSDAHNDTRFGAFQKPVGARIGLDIDLTVDAPQPVLDKVSAKPKKNKHEEAPPTGNSGLIEFDLDLFAISDGKKSNQR